MRIAIIGAGVSGLGAAWALRDVHDVTLFEKEARLGGHANTLTIEDGGAEIAVDTGFIVFNDRNYPNFVALLDHLKVPSFATDMSFAVSDAEGFEWSSNGLGGLFAWKRNLARPAFLAMLNDIVRFSAQARRDLREARLGETTLEDYVARLRLGRGFLYNYLLPMGAAIWSAPEREMLRYPARSFLSFFDNHRLLHARRPRWRTVRGGSQTYVRALRDALGPRVRAGEGVRAVRAEGDHVLVRTALDQERRYDQVIFACHSDEAAALLDPGPQSAALSEIRYAPNTAFLHRDPSFMPRRRAAWAAWNYMRGGGDGRVCVSYWMNALQGLHWHRPLFVTLNPASAPREDMVFAKLSYAHPQFDGAALRAQSAIEAMQGRDRLWFAGAWLGNGFHEDGLRSGLAVAQRLGARIPWTVHDARALPQQAAAGGFAPAPAPA